MLLKPTCRQSGQLDDICSQRDRHDVQKWLPQQSVSCGWRRTREHIGHAYDVSVSPTSEQRWPATRVSTEALRGRSDCVGADSEVEEEGRGLQLDIFGRTVN